MKNFIKYLGVFIIIFLSILTFFLGDKSSRLSNKVLKLDNKVIQLTNQNKILNKQISNINDKKIDLLSSKIYNYILESNQKCDPLIAKKILESILKYSKHYKINPLLLTVMIQVESCFNPFEVSKDGARGLMQVMPKVNKVKFNTYKLHEIDYGIKAGCIVFLEKLELKKDIEQAISKYNGKGKETKNFKIEVMLELARLNFK